MKHTIKQFTNSDELEVSSGKHETCGALVSLGQWAGSMRFTFSMTPEQAKQLAVALIVHAESLEQAE
jgi:hypothetical protein